MSGEMILTAVPYAFCIWFVLLLVKERATAPTRFKMGVDTTHELNIAFGRCQSDFATIHDEALRLGNALQTTLMTRADTDSRWEKGLEQLRFRMNNVSEGAASVGRLDGWTSPQGQNASHRSAGNMNIESVQSLKALLYEWRRELPEQDWKEFERLCEQFDANVAWLNRLMETYYTHMPLERAERSYRPMSYLRVSK